MKSWGNTDTVESAPKWLTDEQKKKCFFVDIAESQAPENRAKGIKTPGWVLYEEYTDGQGNTRHKVETLVSMAVTAANAGDGGSSVIPAIEMINGNEYTIVSVGDTDFTLVGSADNEIGTSFIYDDTTPVTGTGTVSQADSF